jgi:hypothetical protein
VHGFKIYIPEPPFAPVTPNIENQPNSIVGVSSKIIRTRYFESKEPGRRTMEHGTWNDKRWTLFGSGLKKNMCKYKMAV